MTTEDKNVVNDSEVSNDEPKKPRDISTLLELGTYQGMTDEEIEMVFKYKLHQEIGGMEVKLLYNNIEKGNSERMASAERCLQIANEQLELIKSLTFVPKRVNGNE